MNKFKYMILLVSMGASLLFFEDCDVTPATTNINIPIEVNFSSTSTDNSLTSAKSFCLSENSEWNDNKSKIQSAEYLSASYWTISSSTGLAGNFSFSFKTASGTEIFSVSATNFVASAYTGTAYQFNLTEAQKNALNAELANLSNGDKCFQETLSVTGITSEGEHSLVGKVVVVMKVEIEND